MQNTRYIGHLAALITIATWGTTFISTKVLLTGFQPLEILFFRFIMAFFALWLAYPKMLKTDKKQEPVFMAAGLCGICLYYLLENIALTYTQASNVGVIGSTAPFFTPAGALFYAFCRQLKQAVHHRLFHCDDRYCLHQLQRCSHAAQSAG